MVADPGVVCAVAWMGHPRHRCIGGNSLRVRGEGLRTERLFGPHTMSHEIKTQDARKRSWIAEAEDDC